MDVAFVKVLTLLEKVHISLLPLALLNDMLLQFPRFESRDDFSISIIDCAVGIPEVGLNFFSSCKIKVEEEDGFACDAQSEQRREYGGTQRPRMTY